MTKNKLLVLVDNKTLVSKLKDQSNVALLFPIESFCVGFKNTYKLDDIKESAYIFINRILDNKGIVEFKKLLKNLPANIKGIVFDDIGILNTLIEEKSSLTKILFLNHLNCNYESINAYLKYVDSIVVSTDITKEEIEEILNKAKKPLVLYTFGHINIMYSRRTLLTNYNNHFKKNVPLISNLDEDINHHKFKIIENSYGTVIYTEKPFNGLYMREYDNVLYNLINTVFLSDDEVLNIINSENNLEDIYPYKYLNTKETVFKLKDVDL